MKEFRIFMYIQVEGHSTHPILIAKLYNYDVAIDLCDYFESKYGSNLVYFDIDTIIVDSEEEK